MPFDDELDEQEKWVIGQIEAIAREYRKAIEPYAKRLAEIRSWRLPSITIPKADPLPGCDCPACGRGHLIREVPGVNYRKCDHCGITVTHN